MHYILKAILGVMTIITFTSCGSSNNPPTSSVYLEVPQNAPCSGDQFYRLKSKECKPLKNPSWGFAGFEVPSENVYTLQDQNCTQEALKSIIDNLPKEGGKIILPECTILMQDGIVLPSNVILEGAGVGKTILSNRGDSAVSLHGENIIVRNFTLEGNSASLNGINGYRTKGNVLVEFIEARNFKSDQGSGISFLTVDTLENSRVTIRYCDTSNSLHGIAVKVHTSAKMLIYSNQAYSNSNYGIDMSTTSDIEVAGNYLHDNYVAGAKSPLADNIIYHHNDVNFNGKSPTKFDNAGLVYMGSNPTATIIVENNNLSNNGGKAFECWNAKFNHLILRDNIVTGSLDVNGYSIGIVGVNLVDVYGNHGRIWDEKSGNVNKY